MVVGILCHDSWGGSSRIAVQLAEYLAGKGHEVHLFTLCPAMFQTRGSSHLHRHYLCEWSETGRDPSKLYCNWGDAHLDGYTKMVLDKIDRYGISLLNYHYAVPFAEITSRIRRSANHSMVKTIGTLHGTDVSIFGKDSGKDSGLARSLREADLLTTVSESYAVQSHRYFQLSQKPTVIRNFIDLSRYEPKRAAARNVQACNGRYVATHISNFREIKNPLLAVELFDGIRKELDSELWLVGEGELLEPTQQRIRSLGLSSSAKHLGSTLEVCSVLAQSDTLIVSSHSESFCLAALEAMACGVLVLAPRVGGLPELITNGHDGILYEPGRPYEGVREAIRVLKDPRLRSIIASNAIRTATKYSTRKGGDAYERAYRDVLKKERSLSHPSLKEEARPPGSFC